MDDMRAPSRSSERDSIEHRQADDDDLRALAVSQRPDTYRRACQLSTAGYGNRQPRPTAQSAAVGGVRLRG